MTEPSTPSRRARLFRNGANQAVRIPREFEFEGTEVVLEQTAAGLLLRPLAASAPKGTVAALALALERIAAFAPLDDEFPDVDEGLLPLDDIDLGDWDDSHAANSSLASPSSK
jgi:antitoxin VapB